MRRLTLLVTGLLITCYLFSKPKLAVPCHWAIDMIQAIQNFLLLRRQVSVKVEIPIASAKSNLATALSQEVVFTGEFQLTRRYWGYLSDNRLTLYGPRGNRQFCFFVKGNLSEEGSQTLLNGKMHLKSGDFYQLCCAEVGRWGDGGMGRWGDGEIREMRDRI